MSEQKNHRMTRGQWAVHRERCRLTEYRQGPRNNEGEPVGDGVMSLMKKIGLDEQNWIETLSQEWEQIVGKGVGRHTRPGRISGKQLYVFVDSSVWLNELQRYGKTQMLSNLQSKFGEKRIRNISLQLDPE